MFVKVTRKCKDAGLHQYLDVDHVGFLDDSEQCQALESLGCLDENGQPPPCEESATASTFLPF